MTRPSRVRRRLPGRISPRLSAAGAAALAFGLAAAQAQTQASPETRPLSQSPTSPTLHIRILNAQTNKPVIDERLNVSFHPEAIGFLLLPTDKAGFVALHPDPDATTLHLLSNFYADCRPRAELYTNYSLATLRSSGITAGNLCSSTHASAKPGELLLFVIPKNAIRTFGQPPASNLPHSDENPHTTTDNPLTPPPIDHTAPPPQPRSN